jgi:hypothetical protein
MVHASSAAVLIPPSRLDLSSVAVSLRVEGRTFVDFIGCCCLILKEGGSLIVRAAAALL